MSALKYYLKMVDANQKDIYEEIYLPAMKILIQTELTGFPLDMGEVIKAEETLNDYIQKNKLVNFLNIKYFYCIYRIPYILWVLKFNSLYKSSIF